MTEVVITDYRVVALSDARQQGYPYLYPWEDEDDDDGYSSGLWRFENDAAVEYIAKDGGEPEDQSFVRDLSWVVPALKAAYERGFKAASP